MSDCDKCIHKQTEWDDEPCISCGGICFTDKFELEPPTDSNKGD